LVTDMCYQVLQEIAIGSTVVRSLLLAKAIESDPV
jgi:hypothetical protein